jgi:hydrogenase nickel incorporation protein HypA/HybF
MHELSIAQSIIEIVDEEARKHGATQVKKIKLKIGEFSGVVREALEFSFDVVKSGTVAEKAELEIEIVKFKALCNGCGFILEDMNDFNLFCRVCGEPMKIVSGREMNIEYIEIE